MIAAPPSSAGGVNDTVACPSPAVASTSAGAPGTVRGVTDDDVDSALSPSGFDAIAHAVETYVTTKRNPISEIFSREAWRLLEPNYERVLSQPDDLEARGAMQLGAFYAGVAIENSMLGATHACANPLTAHYGTAHGAAIAMLLPSVVRWNERVAGRRYESLFKGTEALAQRLEQLAEVGGLRLGLGAAGVSRAELPALADEAAEQWTGTFNPRPFDRQGAMEVYEWAY